jgi:hypothetical protein
MKARHQITMILKQWLQLTHHESRSIQVNRWSDLAKIQRAKDLLQQPLSDALVQWRIDEPSEPAWNLIGHEIGRLRDLEAQQSELLAVRRREVREKILLLEQALFDLCRFRPTTQKSEAA